MLCVSVANRNSFDNISKWQAEIRSVCPNTPIILVSTKSDLRVNASNQVTVSKEELEQKKLNDLQGWCETSSKAWQDDNVKKAFF